MAKSKDLVITVEERINRLEIYYREHQKTVLVISGIVVALVLGILGVKFWYLPEQETEAETEMYRAQMYFGMDSVNMALKGAGAAQGFDAIADQYSWTPAGHLANYYLGLCYYDKKEYQKAIDCLDKFDAGDVLVSPNAAGVMGDAELQLGNKDLALQDYLEAVKRSNNTLTSPLYMKKAGMVCELNGDYSQAASLYQRIKTEFPNSQQAQDIDKYIYRAKARGGNLEN